MCFYKEVKVPTSSPGAPRQEVSAIVEEHHQIHLRCHSEPLQIPPKMPNGRFHLITAKGIGGQHDHCEGHTGATMDARFRTPPPCRGSMVVCRALFLGGEGGGSAELLSCHTRRSRLKQTHATRRAGRPLFGRRGSAVSLAAPSFLPFPPPRRRAQVTVEDLTPVVRDLVQRSGVLEGTVGLTRGER